MGLTLNMLKGEHHSQNPWASVPTSGGAWIRVYPHIPRASSVLTPPPLVSSCFCCPATPLCLGASVVTRRCLNARETASHQRRWRRGTKGKMFRSQRRRASSLNETKEKVGKNSAVLMAAEWFGSARKKARCSSFCADLHLIWALIICPYWSLSSSLTPPVLSLSSRGFLMKSLFILSSYCCAIIEWNWLLKFCSLGKIKLVNSIARNSLCQNMPKI